MSFQHIVTVVCVVD